MIWQRVNLLKRVIKQVIAIVIDAENEGCIKIIPTEVAMSIRGKIKNLNFDISFLYKSKKNAVPTITANLANSEV